MRNLWEDFKNWVLSNIVVILLLSFYFGPTLLGGIVLAGSAILPDENPLDYVRITDVDYKARVNDEESGKISITETITFDIHAASRYNGFWEIWRDLPESTVDGVRVTYDVESVKQVFPDGTKREWAESPKLYWDDYDFIATDKGLGPGKWYHSPGPYNEYGRDYECLLFYVNDIYRDTMTFEIQYDMYNAVLGYNDCADLYISMFSGSDVNYLNSFKAQILIPDSKMPNEGEYQYTTYGTKKGSFPVVESTVLNQGYHTFLMNLDKKDLKFDNNTEFIEFDLVSYGDSKHAFAQNTSQNTYSNDDVLDVILEEQEEYFSEIKNTRTMKLIGLFLCCIVSIIILFASEFIKSNLRLKNRFYHNDTPIPQFRDIPSDLDPKFASDLVFCKHKGPKDDSAVYSSILLSLAQKQYISLSEVAENVWITLLKPEKLALDASKKHLQYDGTVWDVPSTLDVSLSPTEDFVQNSELDLKDSAHDEIEFDSRCSIENEVFSQTSIRNFYSQKPTGNYNALGSDFGRNKKVDERTELSPYKINDTREALSLSERYYLETIESIAGSKERISLSQLQSSLSSSYRQSSTLLDRMNNVPIIQGLSSEYIQSAQWKTPRKHFENYANNLLFLGIVFSILGHLIAMQTRVGTMYYGFIIVLISCIISSCIMKKQGRKHILLTELGEEEYRKWRGLYDFLKSDTLIKERTVVELPLWEKYLIYATAFGISEKVVKAISIRCPQMTQQTANSSSNMSIIHNSYCRSGRIRHSGTRIHSSIRTGSSRSHYSGYSGGGYGGSSFGGSHHYGGGGRGGGGGGGGH